MSQDVHLFSKSGYSPIEDYGVIGNLHTLALISKKGSIDFMPFSRFDAPTIFTSLLDKNKGGFFEITSCDEDVNYRQMYLPDTAVLLTRFLASSGVSELTDFMPVKSEQDHCVLVRKLKVVRGKVNFHLKCSPSFGYAKNGCEIEQLEEGFLFRDPQQAQCDVLLKSDVDLDVEAQGVYKKFTLEEGQEVEFILTTSQNEQATVPSSELQQQTVDFWREWISKCTYNGRWRTDVHRSLITLKLLTSYRFGSVIAAGTFSLPERVGHERNWDYRYVWIRDAAFTMYAFLRMGFMEEADRFMDFIRDQCVDQELQLLYKVDGNSHLPEKELDHLEGYMNSRPVRIGNNAAQQLQLDIYGELIDTIYLYGRYGGSITYDFWQKIEKQIEFVCDHWQEPDESIWEVRSGKKEFLHSRLLCWVALDRAVRICEMYSFPSDVDRWVSIRDEIYLDIHENFWNEERQTFVQFKGADHVDASGLLLPLLRFCSSSEPKWEKTFQKIKEELVTEPLVYRYIIEDEKMDGFSSIEGTFSICSFWYVECLARTDRLQEATLNFEKMLGYANHLGLFSEEIGLDGKQLGNFPQAFTHLAMISAAYMIEKKNKEND